jgi:hypothetical protein
MERQAIRITCLDFKVVLLAHVSFGRLYVNQSLTV